MSSLFSTSSLPPPRQFTPSPDSLFSYIETLQTSSSTSNPNFGDFLDSGTGSHSLDWLVKLENEGCLKSWKAVTADTKMQNSVIAKLKSMKLDSVGQVLIGNWASTSETTANNPTTIISHNTGKLLPDSKFDAILADYLIGAVDGFSPYYQDLILPRLKTHLKPGGKIYVVGLNPIPDTFPGDGDIICEIRRLRDACILLAGHRCYREYPIEWIERHMEQIGFECESKRFPILWSKASTLRQVNVAKSKLPLMKGSVRQGMAKEIERIEKEVDRLFEGGNKKIQVGFDYVVAGTLLEDKMEE
ncbi:hypothetical protein TL16_g02222 [Triparma laevis f. inornata]|uniref:Uncharacterized protein n=1 Tax=Triparma laevis f. inornata TaxID=1714386 RepID=A0A9W6ZUI8_9STRA|nr:hypothetical protein TL16_g02222 [Triparma laevis f. inornata]